MNTAILERYKEIRQDHVSRYAGNGALYHHKVTASAALQSAKYYVETNQAWENAGELVKLEIVPDKWADIEDLAGDCYNPEVNSNIQPHVLEKQYKEFIDRVNHDGVYGIVGKYYNGEEWVTADSCWGFVGDDWKDSGYDLDIMAVTLDELNNLEICECCGRPKVK